MDIKFYGKRIDSGETVEGDLYHAHGNVYISKDLEEHRVVSTTVEIVTPLYKAAPAMYEALKALVSLLDGEDPVELGCHCTDTGTGAPLICAWCEAKKALALAEGGE